MVNLARRPGLTGVVALVVLAAARLAVMGQTGRSVSGVVVTHGVPAAGAVVRAQGTGASTVTDDRGSFQLAIGDASAEPVYITAAKPGFFNTRAPLLAGATSLVLDLSPIPDADNEQYRWQEPAPNPRSPDNCGNCHDAIFNEWSRDQHAAAAVNAFVRTMYDGTDVRGRRDVGPGYRRDWADEGNCANCHAPLATANSDRLVDLTAVGGVQRTGVSCDFCHKVAQVPSTPHISALRVRRPPLNGKLLFGPLDDATFPGDVPDFSVAPMFKTSEYCASCHEAQYWGVPVYSTFSEWRATSFARLGVQCQTCHMAPTGAMTHVARTDKGGRRRDPSTLASHATMTDDPAQFIRTAAQLDARASLDPGGRTMRVVVNVANVRAGHDLPTGQPMRHMLLVVTANDATGRALVLEDGARLPSWVGDYAGEPGRAFAKILVESSEYAKPISVAPDGGVNLDFPAPFWRRNRIQSDTRIPAGERSRSEFVFRAAPADSATVRVRLIYRKAFKPLALVKGWTAPDLVMASEDLRVPVAVTRTGGH